MGLGGAAAEQLGDGLGGLGDGLGDMFDGFDF